MKRKLIMGLLALGTLGGFASGFKSMRYHRYHRHSTFKRHVTDICSDAMRQAQTPAQPAAKPQQP